MGKSEVVITGVMDPVQSTEGIWININQKSDMTILRRGRSKSAIPVVTAYRSFNVSIAVGLDSIQMLVENAMMLLSMCQ